MEEKQVWINEVACIKCGSCIRICPLSYEMNDEGMINILNDECPQAIQVCPTKSLKYE